MNGLIANALGPVFFVLALGYFAGYRKIVDNRSLAPLTFTLMNFALPAALFISIAETSRKILLAQTPLIFTLGASMLVIYASTWLIQRKLRTGPSQSAVQALTVAFPNCVAVGIPLLGSLFGPEGLVPVAVAIAVGAIVVSPLTLSILEATPQQAQKQAAGVRFVQAVFGAFRKPVVLAPLFGLVMSASGFRLPDLATRMLMLIGQTTGGLALFLTGLIISAHPFKLDKSVVTGTLLKNVLQVGVMLLLVHSTRIPQPFAREALMIAALPAGFFGTVFSVAYDEPPVIASSTLAASTVFSIVTLPLVIFLIRA